MADEGDLVISQIETNGSNTRASDTRQKRPRRHHVGWAVVLVAVSMSPARGQTTYQGLLVHDPMPGLFNVDKPWVDVSAIHDNSGSCGILIGAIDAGYGIGGIPEVGYNETVQRCRTNPSSTISDANNWAMRCPGPLTLPTIEACQKSRAEFIQKFPSFANTPPNPYDGKQ